MAASGGTDTGVYLGGMVPWYPWYHGTLPYPHPGTYSPVYRTPLPCRTGQNIGLGGIEEPRNTRKYPENSRFSGRSWVSGHYLRALTRGARNGRLAILAIPVRILYLGNLECPFLQKRTYPEPVTFWYHSWQVLTESGSRHA